MYGKVLVLVFCLTFNAFASADSASLKDAEESVAAFLTMVDGQNYDETWGQASSLLRESVSQADWVKNIEQFRRPLGALTQRDIKSTEAHESLPELPDGEYVIFIFTSSFEKRKSVTEVVAVTKESDSKWRVIGYYGA